VNDSELKFCEKRDGLKIFAASGSAGPVLPSVDIHPTHRWITDPQFLQGGYPRYTNARRVDGIARENLNIIYVERMDDFP
jgi:hypothetical protein